ncbi:MAG: N-glycosylase/DNA lyase [Candidatus Thermoplasmatota archaeon]|nr:N-glycosylase/DNA lyase [Candidatus Thermoplasmatota archaeon]
MECTPLKDLHRIYGDVEHTVKSRVEEFSNVWAHGSEEDVYAELVFCIFTPQSKARWCWSTVEKLREKDLLLNGSEKDVLEELNMVRFKYKKAGFAVQSRKHFVVGGEVNIREKLEGMGSPYEIRQWLVENVKGLGFKEASHFLRNVGVGGELAILDRHILKNLVCLGVIEEIPSLTTNRYMDIEQKMQQFAESQGIPMAHLDLVLWYKEAGEVFK